jgi:hypothetical protein
MFTWLPASLADWLASKTFAIGVRDYTDSSQTLDMCWLVHIAVIDRAADDLANQTEAGVSNAPGEAESAAR